MKTVALFLFFIAVPIIVCGAQVPFESISSFRGQQLKWENGGVDYAILIKSALANTENLGLAANPQGDTCLQESTGRFLQTLPHDAYVEKAFLIWSGTVDPEKIAEPVPHTVTLTYYNQQTETKEAFIVTADRQGFIDGESDFSFEGFSVNSNGSGTTAHFTYRADISAYLQSVVEKVSALGILPGKILTGDYTVSGIPCSSADFYKGSTSMVAGWSILLIYRSEMESKAQNIYLYNGFKRYQHEQSDLTISGFKLPKEADFRVTLLSHEGDIGLYSTAQPFFEGVLLKSSNGNQYQLSNVCNPWTGLYFEVFNNISSMGGDSANEPFCLGGKPNVLDKATMEYSIEADTFFLNSGAEGMQEFLAANATSLQLGVAANQDMAILNLLVVAVETQMPNFDIPEKQELFSCICSTENDQGSAVCGGAEVENYLLIRVENWGSGDSGIVYAQTTIDNGYFKYVPASTEIATQFDEKGNGTNWQQLPDGPGGISPLLEPNLIANNMKSHLDSAGEAETMLIRYRIQNNGSIKHGKGSSAAYISTEFGGTYASNNNIPLGLWQKTCEQACSTEELKARCGGLTPLPEIANDEDSALPDTDSGTEVPDAAGAANPKAEHPMKTQNFGCSLIL